MARDRIVFGIRDNAVGAKLLGDSELTLEKAVTTCRTSEITTKQLQRMEGETVYYAKSREKKKRTSRYRGELHKQGDCPAYEKPCDKCQKMNHAANVCRTKMQQEEEKSKPGEKKNQRHRPRRIGRTSVHMVEENDCSETPEESAYSLKSGTRNKCFVDLQIRRSESKVTKVRFQSDTGATCSTMSIRDYRKVIDEAPDTSTKTPRLYDNSTTKSVGHARLKCGANGK